MEYVANTSGWRQSIENFIGHTKVQHTLVVLIVVNALILGLETSQNIMAVAGYELHLIDQIILWIFIGELALLMTARGFRFFKDPWCVFDLIVIGIALIPATGSLSVLRALRVLRVRPRSARARAAWRTAVRCGATVRRACARPRGPPGKPRVALVTPLPFGTAATGQKLYFQDPTWQEFLARTAKWLAGGK
jgi:hypothetical protein